MAEALIAGPDPFDGYAPAIVVLHYLVSHNDPCCLNYEAKVRRMCLQVNHVSSFDVLEQRVEARCIFRFISNASNAMPDKISGNVPLVSVSSPETKDRHIYSLADYTSGAQLTVISSLNWLTSLSATTKTALYSRSSGLPAASMGRLST